MYRIPIYYATVEEPQSSFYLVSQKHIEYLKKIGFRYVYPVSGRLLLYLTPVSKGVLIVHPPYYILHNFLLRLDEMPPSDRLYYASWWRSRFTKIINIGVCDSDRLSDYAVKLLELGDIVVMPSKYCVEVARRSGVNRPVYLVPHGLDDKWYRLPNMWVTAPPVRLNPELIRLFLLKIQHNTKFILFFLSHSPDRKGWEEVVEAYKRIREKRDDVRIIVKTLQPQVSLLGELTKLGAIELYGWLTEEEKMALYDLVDVTWLFSRGGGFELNCLESIARGTPCIAHDAGPWTEYLPRFLWVKHGERVQPLPNNMLHVGYGYKIDVEDAVKKTLDILSRKEEYKSRLVEWREKVLIKKYNWLNVARRLKRLIVS